MAGDRTAETFEIVADHKAFLEEMADRYDLPDSGKALRVLIDYAMSDGNRDQIFNEIRCLRCSG